MLEHRCYRRFPSNETFGELEMIRVAKVNDAPVMTRIAKLAYGKYLELLAHPPIPILHDYVEVAEAGNTYVLVLKRQVVGMVTYVTEVDHLLLRNLAVLPEYQGKGLGRKLVDFVEAEAHYRGLTEVRLWTREEMTDNIRYYERLGYFLTHRDVVDDCARVYLRKRLDGA